ncbi:MAG TPA: DNA alkylation repair protein [Planctomycetota bacterium]|nr:DNA alkylation repair protein [Planctomycetota bacterium]
MRRAFSKRLRTTSGREVVSAALALRKRGGLSRHFIACELVRHHPAALASLSGSDLERFGKGLDSWVSVDVFATYLSGPAWREGQVTDAWIRSWAGSPDRWRRRAALVSTVPLNSRTHGGDGDPARTLTVGALLIDDRDDMVVKALSWALRELAKRDPAPVRAFLRREAKRLAPRVLREVGNKLRTGKKNP